MNGPSLASAAAIHAAFAVPVQYLGAGLDGAAEPITAVKTDEEADPFQGPGRTLRRIGFEVLQADLPDEPAKTDTLTELDEETLDPIPGRAWKVNEIRRRDDIGAWHLIVERAPE